MHFGSRNPTRLQRPEHTARTVAQREIRLQRAWQLGNERVQLPPWLGDAP